MNKLKNGADFFKQMAQRMKENPEDIIVIDSIPKPSDDVQKDSDSLNSK